MTFPIFVKTPTSKIPSEWKYWKKYLTKIQKVAFRKMHLENIVWKCNLLMPQCIKVLGWTHCSLYRDCLAWKHLPHYWLFVRGNHTKKPLRGSISFPTLSRLLSWDIGLTISTLHDELCKQDYNKSVKRNLCKCSLSQSLHSWLKSKLYC